MMNRPKRSPCGGSHDLIAPLSQRKILRNVAKYTPCGVGAMVHTSPNSAPGLDLRIETYCSSPFLPGCRYPKSRCAPTNMVPSSPAARERTAELPAIRVLRQET